MGRLIASIPWVAAPILLLTRVVPAGDPIEALRQAELEARAKLAKAYGELEKAGRALETPGVLQPPPLPGTPPSRDQQKFDRVENAVREAESKAQQAAEARRAAEAKNINTPKTATEARERFEAAADRAKRAAERSDVELSVMGIPVPESIDEAVAKNLREFDAAEARKDFKSALEREAELLDKEADRLEAEAKKPGASDQTKAAAARARKAVDRAADRLGTEFPPYPGVPLFPLEGMSEKLSDQPKTTGTMSIATGGPKTAGSQPVSADVAVVVDNRPGTIVCLPKGAKIAGLNGEVIAEGPTEVLVVTSKTPEEVQRLAKASGVMLCFVEIDFCVIKTPLTAFRGHDHRSHPGGIHNHDAPDPPWSWAVTPPEPVVSWGGG